MDVENSATKSFFAPLNGAVIFLLAVLFLELTLSIRQETQTWDEACHIFSGYSYWTRGDFGMNPEHPPLLKLLATIPLLPMNLKVPDHPSVFSKEEDFTTATDFVYGNNAQKILFRARAFAAVLTVLLALTVFLAARRMFENTAALIAVTLLVLEPTILAHGALVTTDVAMSCFLFAAVFAFYRYVKRPGWSALALTGIPAGLGLAAKHSGILIFPILILLAAGELLISGERRSRQAMRLGRAIVVISVIAVAMLWASYGFRLHPRSGFDASARVEQYASRLHHPVQAQMIQAFAKWHLLPEAYLFGLADVGFTADFSHTYLLGKIYPHGVWYYFPIAFAIKASPALILLLLLVPLALWRGWAEHRREILFLTIPAAIYFAVAMASRMNIGIRHILPMFPFLFVLAGWAAATLIQRRRRWAYIVVAVLVFDTVSSVRAFPAYIPYANDLWGGPANTYKYLSDSNADWGQQLKSIKKYVDDRGIKDCYFAYFAGVVTDPAYYGIPCKPLTTIASVWLQPWIDVPSHVDGTVFISAGVLSGYEFGPDVLNPYDQFQRIRPTAIIEHGVFVFDGHFDIPLASALNHITRSQLLAKQSRLDDAVSEARLAVSIAPAAFQTESALGFLLLQTKRPDEAREHLQRALTLAQSVHPEFRDEWTIPGLKAALGQ